MEVGRRPRQQTRFRIGQRERQEARVERRQCQQSHKDRWGSGPYHRQHVRPHENSSVRPRNLRTLRNVRLRVPHHAASVQENYEISGR